MKSWERRTFLSASYELARYVPNMSGYILAGRHAGKLSKQMLSKDIWHIVSMLQVSGFFTLMSENFTVRLRIDRVCAS